jgi:hypothetical protein
MINKYLQKLKEELNLEYNYNFSDLLCYNSEISLFLLALNLDNEIIFKNEANLEEEETDNKVVVLTNITAINNKLYSKMMYIIDNPTTGKFAQINDTVGNFICNNPINISHYKNSMDPKFTEYINRLQSSIAEYIDEKC